VRRIDRTWVDRQVRRLLSRRLYHSAKAAYYEARTLARRNPGRGRLLPDFLIVGSTKCGTTSLFNWLGAHPFVAETEKEIHFFDMHYDRGADWYRSHFPLETERAAFAREHGRPFIVGEGSAAYLANYWAPRRAALLVPDARLIVSLRDPVDRAYSQYHYFRRRGSEPIETFEEAVDAEEERLRGEAEREAGDRHRHSWRIYRWGYLTISRYAEHIERWLELFPREQFLFLDFDELVTEPQHALDAVHEHLGLPARAAPELRPLNVGDYEPLPPETRARLDEYFRPHNERLRELTGRDFAWLR
jgi:hypothetical protein